MQLRSFLADGPAGTDPAGTGWTTTVGLGAPVPRPSKIICIGLNYRDHAAESGPDVSARHVQNWTSQWTLEPGDIIATGTPGGVGFAQNPPRRSS